MTEFSFLGELTFKYNWQRMRKMLSITKENYFIFRIFVSFYNKIDKYIGRNPLKITVYEAICLFSTIYSTISSVQGSTVPAFHSHLRLKIDVCELENAFRSMSANTIQNTKQPNLYSSQ